MKAIEKNPDHDAINAEYDRFKSLRELETMLRDRPSNSDSIIILPVVLSISAGWQIAMRLGGDGILTFLSFLAAIFGWIVYFQSRAHKDYWSKISKTLRTLADDVNKLRAASK